MQFVDRFLASVGVNRPYLPRIILIIIGVLAAVVLAFADVVFAQEVTTDEPPRQVLDEEKRKAVKNKDADLLAAIDELIDSLWPYLVKEQAAYREMTGRYFQGLPTHFDGELPEDGYGLYPSGWYTHPTDQQYRWSDFNVIKFDRASFVMQIDTYNGPEGTGWVACYRLQIKKTPWQRCRNYGPEALRNTDWAIVTSEAEK